MDKDTRSTAVLAISALAILGVCVFSVSWGPHSATQLQARVEESANAALLKANLGFWHATAHGQAVDLEGVAPDDEGRLDAIKLVGDADGVTDVRASGVSVIPATSPFAWSAILQDGRVELSGVAPSRAAANAVHEAAWRLFGADMSDDMTLASGAPAGIAWDTAAIQGLEALHRMKSGSVRLVDAQLTLSGVAAGETEAAQIAALIREPGIGITATANVVGSSEWSGAATGGPAMPEIAGLNLSTADGCETALNRVAGDGLLAFDRGGVRLDLTDNAPLDKLVAVARACGAQRIEIQSHTDNSGRRSNNLSLSRRRAIAVKDYLVKQGLSGDRLTAIGFGPDRPVASNRTEAGRAQNRRVEFRVIREESR